MADLDPNHLAVRIKSMLLDAQPFYPAECCIYRVPAQIRNLKPDAYTPTVVSIGPFHHGDARLRKMEGHKKIYCQKFIERSRASLAKLLTRVQELEPNVRRCYSDEINLSAEEFIYLILVDCGFVLEFLSGWHNDDAVTSTPWLRTSILEDLFLLENQLPFFVFQELNNLAFPPPLNGYGLPFDVRLSAHRLMLDTSPNANFLHFTDLLRISYLQPSGERPSREAELTQIHSATKLNAAGVKFTLKEASNCLLDLDISGHILKIPEILVDDWTENRLRNMMALEQCHYPAESYIIDYVKILDFLINTDKDVDFLVKKRIIVHWLGDSNEVAELFNGLCKNITQTKFNTKYFNICKELNDYYNHPFHKRMATLRGDYCNTAWKTVASIAGIILLILTVVQTGCSILQV